jgi:hypothetical protein
MESAIVTFGSAPSFMSCSISFMNGTSLQTAQNNSIIKFDNIIIFQMVPTMKQLVLSLAVLAMGNVCIGMYQPVAIILKDNPLTNVVLNSKMNGVLIIGSGIPAGLLAVIYASPHAELREVKIKSNNI